MKRMSALDLLVGEVVTKKGQEEHVVSIQSPVAWALSFSPFYFSASLVS